MPAQLKALVRSLGDKLLNLVTTFSIVILKYVRYSFAGRAMKPNDKKEIDRLQEEPNKLKSDVSDGISLHVAHAVDEIGTNVEDIRLNVEDIGANLEDMGKFEKARRNLDAMFAKLVLDAQVSFDGSGQPLCQKGTRIDILEEIIRWAYDCSSVNVGWLRGPGGSGKSTVAQTIADHFRLLKQLGAYTFYTRAKSNPGLVIRMLSVLIHSK